MRQYCRARANDTTNTKNMSKKIEQKHPVAYFMSLSQHLSVVTEQIRE